MTIKEAIEDNFCLASDQDEILANFLLGKKVLIKSMFFEIYSLLIHSEEASGKFYNTRIIQLDPTDIDTTYRFTGTYLYKGKKFAPVQYCSKDNFLNILKTTFSKFE